MNVKTILKLVGTGLLSLWGLWAYAAAANPVVEIEKALQKLPQLTQMKEAGWLLLDEHGRTLQARSAQRLLVPASTTKLVTAYLALQHWGAEHRFHSDFFLERTGEQNQLVVKGYGDPFLTSEELLKVAERLKQKLSELRVDRLDSIVLDASYFSEGLVLPGTQHSDNPYDAIPSAIAANFNTLFLQKNNGRVVSAEPQTPLTPLAAQLGQSLADQPQRVNTGVDPKIAQRYFAELLAAFLRAHGIEVGDSVRWQRHRNADGLIYRHYNSHTLAQVIRPMMKYSTNFIANQLVLMLAAERYGAPADEDKVVQFFAKELNGRFGWRDAYLEDGAGLSRNNRLSPQYLIEVLEAFRPWKQLLPEVEMHVYAKSGSLIGVSTLAGYIKRDEDWLPFAVMMNEPIPYYHFRNRIAAELSQALR